MFVGIGVGIGRNRFAQGIFNAYNLRVVADGGITEAGNCVNAVTGLLLNASLLIIPSGYKGGKAYAEIPTNGNGDLTWTRASDAWRTNADGLIQRVPWNLLQQSETFDNAYWTKSNSTISANSTTAPNGTVTADTLIEDTSNSTHRIFNNSAVTISNTIASTYSVYLKSAGRTRAWVRDNDIVGALFNLSNGTIVSTEGTATATITNVGDGWYRCTITKVSSGTSGRIVVYLDNGTSETYTGNGTSGVYIWGAQLVEGSSAQTYLPTTDRLNVPRLSYMYGSCPALLLEPQRTNLITQSEDFTNADWIKAQATVSGNNTTAPDGNNTADKLIINNGAAGGYAYQAKSTTSGTIYTGSFYVKAAGVLFTKFQTNISGSYQSAVVNLSTGAITNSTFATTPTATSVGNGWYRVSYTVTSGGSNVVMYIDGGCTSIGGTFTGNGTDGIFIWGGQLEIGAYPTTYIPTTTASATRIADSFSRNNIFTNGLITSSGGTWFVELRNNIVYTRDSVMYLGIGDTSTLNSNAIFIMPGVTSLAAIRKRVAGSESVIYTTTTTTTKIIVKWNGSTADVFANGTKVTSATSFTTTNMEFFAANATAVPLFIQAMALYPSPLSDTDCTTLTTL